MDVDDRMRVPDVLRIIPTNVSLSALHLLRQQIGFVEEENDGDALKGGVVNYRVENVF